MEQEKNLQTQIKKFSFENFMLFVAVAGQIPFYFQATLIFLHQSARDVTLHGYCIQCLSLIFWLIYGIKIKNKVVVLANIFGVLGAMLVVVGILMYG